ncbi:apyrase-like [Anopheles albimanus]|uniref:apyrase-like n=1 Tax=Anopheles albimanus TaxID=7167 RepID=UPI001641F28E|nr:apyrase-like [Anopheles albimanus]
MWQVLIIVATFIGKLRAADNLPANRVELDQLFPVTLIHMNDLHARFDETSNKSSKCRADLGEECIAGIARIQYAVSKLRSEFFNHTPLLLNAGDNYQGTIWYNYHRWKVVAQFMELLHPDAMTLGNHEFDDGLEGLAPYLSHLQSVGIPTVVSNLIDKSGGIPKLPPSLIIERQKRLIGIIGVIYDKTNELSKTGELEFTDSIATVRAEAEKLKQRGVNIIIVLSHCGLEIDKQIAVEAGDHVDVIVGGHSHSFLFSPASDQPYNEQDTIQGDYPVVIENDNGRKILIVQAYAYGKYIGRLTTYFDADGEIVYWEGYPVYMRHDVYQHGSTFRLVKKLRKQVQSYASTKIAETRIDLEQETCRTRECRLGNIFADAIADYYTNETFHPVAIVNAGNFRTPIPSGDITNEDAIGAAPFSNSVELLTLRGDSLWNLIEHSVVWSASKRLNVMQVSGIKIVADLNRKPYARVLTIEVQDLRSKLYKPLNRTATYKVVTLSFLASGKDGFKWALECTDRQIGPLDSDVFIGYLKKLKVITEQNLRSGRFFLNGTVTS